MANEEIRITKEELNRLLADAARRGAEEAQETASRMVDCDEEDVQALAFIKTFEPDGLEPLGIFSKRSIPGKVLSYVLSRRPLRDLQNKISEFNDFEAHMKVYYDYAEDPELKRDELTDSEYNRYVLKHGIYLRLHEEKLRRFGLFGLHRGFVDVKILG